MVCHRWEEIDHPDAVQTPADVYGSLAHEGFAVKYVRVPVTDGTAPSVSSCSMAQCMCVCPSVGSNQIRARACDVQYYSFNKLVLYGSMHVRVPM